MTRTHQACKNFSRPILIIIFFGSSQGALIEDVTTNLGLLPIKLGHARTIDFYHTVTHYYQMDGLLSEINQIRSYHQTVLTRATTDMHPDKFKESVQIKFRLIEHMLLQAEERLQNSILPRRQRRGLINGLGSLIKFITGNLDSSDAEKYDSIIAHLKENQETISKQFEHHYSINSNVLNQLNSTIEDINFNQNLLSNEINSLRKLYTTKLYVDAINTVLDHNQAILQTVLDITQDIQNSVTFCKLKKLHPSIIKPQTLLKTLDDLKQYYGNKMPDYQGEALWDLQSHIKVNCVIGTEEIIYFLDIPILNESTNELFSLQPIPTQFSHDSYVTIIPSAKFALKSITSPVVQFLNKECEHGLNYFYCPNHLQLAGETDCEKDILLHGLNGRCELIKLDLTKNHVEFLEIAKRYIFIFPFEDQIKITNHDDVSFRKLQGIFLVSPENSTIEYHNQTLVAPPTNSYQHPSLVRHIKMPDDINKNPIAQTKLKNLNYLSVPSRPIPHGIALKIFTPSVWTVALYVIVLTFIVYTSIRYYQHVHFHSPN